MKLKNKLLTVLPIATISVVTPIVVSGCSCSSSYEIKYGDSINCSNKDDKNIKYHSIDEVKNATRDHVQVQSSEPITWQDALDLLRGSQKNSKLVQQFYWDLAYSAANEHISFTLVWTVNNEKSDVIFNSTTYTSLEYKLEGNDYYIYGNGSTKLVKSFAYSQPK